MWTLTIETPRLANWSFAITCLPGFPSGRAFNKKVRPLPISGVEMNAEELTKQQAAALRLPSRNPFDGDEVIWSPRLPDPETEFENLQEAA